MRWHTPDGAVILPVSRVSFGFVSGGGEYGQGGSIRDTSKDLTENPFAGGSGAGISLHPMGFVVVNAENIRLLPVQPTCLTDHIADLVPQVFQFINECNTAQGACQGRTRRAGFLCVQNHERGNSGVTVRPFYRDKGRYRFRRERFCRSLCIFFSSFSYTTSGRRRSL